MWLSCVHNSPSNKGNRPLIAINNNRNENFGYMTSNESTGFRVSYTRVKKIQQGAFMKEIFSVNLGVRVGKKFSVVKKKRQSMSWAESTGVERQGLKVRHHPWVVKIEYWGLVFSLKVDRHLANKSNPSFVLSNLPHASKTKAKFYSIQSARWGYLGG